MSLDILVLPLDIGAMSSDGDRYRSTLAQHLWIKAQYL